MPLVTRRFGLRVGWCRIMLKQILLPLTGVRGICQDRARSGVTQ